MNASILLIQSKNSKNSSMGTGFVVHQDAGGCYVLTCNHVLEAVKEPKIDDFEIEIILENELYDLALLYVQGLESKPLILKECAKETSVNRDVSFVGYRKFKNEEFRQNRRESKILDKGSHKRNDSYFDVWEVMAKENHVILHGYSGSPLILNGQVIAVMTNKEKSDRGFATTIQCLSLMWKEMPLDLILQESSTNNPFVGLRAFTKADSSFFFGRDKEVEEIIEKLGKSRFLALVGDSGSGKSSIVKAKVIPYYLEQGYCVLEMRPANDPYTELNIKLKNRLSQRDNLSILDACHTFCDNKSRRLLIYIDQFEELFTGHESRDSILERESFLNTLLYLYKNETSRLKIEILFTMRSDYYPRLDGYKEFIDLIEKNREENKYVIQRMEKEQLEETIYKPLVKALIVHKKEAKTFAYFVVKGMVKSQSNEITLLQIALTQTLKNEEGKDLFDAYKNVGGVSRALHTLANETINAIDKEEELKIIFIRLLNFSKEGNHTRRIAQKNEFSDEQWRLIQLLSSALDISGKRAIRNIDEKLGRLLKLNEENQTVELVHEALITGWDTYAHWILGSGHFKPIHDSVMGKTQEYHEDKKNKGYLLTGIPLIKALSLLEDKYRDFLSIDEIDYIEDSQKHEEKKERRDRNMLRGLKASVVVLVGFLGISGYFWYEAKIAEKKAVKSEKQVINILDKATNGAVVIVEKNNPLYATLTFKYVIKNFLETTDINILKIVVKAWFGEALILQKSKKHKESIDKYSRLIKEMRTEKNPNIIQFVAKSFFNKGVALYDINETAEAINTYTDLIENFKDSEDDKVLYQVAKSWYLKGKYVEKSRQLEVFLNFTTHFKESKNRKILQKTSMAYGRMGWIELIKEDYDKSIKFTKEGLETRKDEFWIEINLAHAYFLRNKSNDRDNAKAIYLKYKEKRAEILEEFQELEKNGILISSFKDIEKMLFGK